ncbi:MAG TPA: hypothetical protein PKZ53_12090 [Acidobacteriota bacterium]|nr:hypothetical protein [Acidobacteriota bacterium]HNB72755.1 hypothetical protein [Acidobacteriota bacterium]HNJ41224.1 hypothetical protein [Acidobacteriota bacterium]
MKLLSLSLFVVLLFSTAVVAQNSPTASQSGAPASTTEATSSPTGSTLAEFDRLRLEGFTAVYNIDYATAKKDFRQMIELDPEKPAGYLYVANALWLEQLNKSRRLQIGVYNDDSFYSETKETIDPKFDKEFRDLLAKAIAKAEARLKTTPNDTQTLYFLGAAHGVLAAYEATVARSFISALKNGDKSVDLHRKVLELDPKCMDANLTIGMYNYVVGSLPLPVKVLAAMGGFRGSKKKGLALLEQVTEQGTYVPDDARVILTALYKREKRYADALRQLEVLGKKYPANYLVKMETADALIRLGKYDESSKLFAELLADPRTATSRDLIEYQFAEALAAQDRDADAAEHYAAVIAFKNANADLVTLSHLKLGQINDLLSKRQEAVAHYNKVLSRKNVFDSQDRAKEWLKKPYVRSRNEAKPDTPAEP